MIETEVESLDKNYLFSRCILFVAKALGSVSQLPRDYFEGDGDELDPGMIE